MSEQLYGWYYSDDGSDLTQEEKEYNARRGTAFLMQNGFTRYAAAATIGNAWAESQMNPGRWQHDTPYSGGYGLMQWTPYTKYSDWAGADWMNNGPLEMQRLIYERQEGLQFYPSERWPQWTYRKYCTLDPTEEGMTPIEVVEMFTDIWVYNYLRPRDPEANMSNRKYHARYVYQHCMGSPLPPWLLLWWNNKNRRVIR